MEITLADLVGGQVIEANKKRVVISKDGKKYEIEIGSTIIREMNKQH